MWKCPPPPREQVGHRTFVKAQNPESQKQICHKASICSTEARVRSRTLARDVLFTSSKTRALLGKQSGS